MISGPSRKSRMGRDYPWLGPRLCNVATQMSFAAKRGMAVEFGFSSLPSKC